MYKIFTHPSVASFALLTTSQFVKSNASCPAWHVCKNGRECDAIFHYKANLCDFCIELQLLYEVPQQCDVKCECQTAVQAIWFTGEDWHKYTLAWYFYWHFWVFLQASRNFILHLLAVQTLCIFPRKPALLLHLIPCCTGAEHYVNLVIGTGPSPLYGFLLSRSTWLVKEDGMKINEVQLIQEGGTSPTLPLRR